MNLRITGPFIDRVSITAPFEIEYAESLASILRDVVDSDFNDTYTVQLLSRRPDNLYRWAFSVWPRNNCDEFIHVSVLHHDPRKNQFRLDFNPANFTEEHVPGVHDFLSLVFSDVHTNNMRGNCSVTRLDVAQDIVGLRMDDILVYSPRKQKGCIWGGGKSGIETIYCGAPTSRGRVKVYRKPFPARPLNGRSSRRRRIRPRIRCEVTLKPQDTIGALYDLPNPFRNVVFSYLAGVKRSSALPKHEIQFFIDSCLRRGTQDALALIENKRRKAEYKSILGQNRVEEISADTLWAHWGDEIDKLRVLMGDIDARYP